MTLLNAAGLKTIDIVVYSLEYVLGHLVLVCVPYHPGYFVSHLSGSFTQFICLMSYFLE